jgi:hypothetical protein
MRLAFGTPLAALLALGWAPGAAASDRKSCADGDPEACARMEALGPAIADCLGGDIDRCAALADEDLDGAPVREHGCDRAGPACEVALQSAERGWLELGDALLFHLREVACARGDAARCEVPADRLTGPRPIGHPGRVVGFDASGALLASSGEDVSGFDPSTASPLDAGTAGNGNVVLDLQPAPDGWTATVLARTGPRREAGDLGLVGPTGEVQWIPGPVCSSRSLPGGGALVVVGRDKSCAEAVALERVDGRGQRIGPRWSWSGPPPTGFDTGPTGLVAVDAAGRLLVKSGAGAPVTVPTPRPIVAARFVGSRILAIAEPGWWLLSPAAGGFRVTGEGPESLDAVAVAPDGSAFVFTHRREQIRYVRRVDPARVGEGVGFALGYEAHRVDADVALSPDGHTVVVGGGGGIDVLDHRPAREVGAWAAPPWTPTKVVGKPQHLVVVDTEGRPVAGASVSSRNGAEHVTGPDGAVVVEPGPVAVTTPDGRSGSVVDSHGRVVVTVHDRVWFRVVDQGGEPVRGLEVRPRGGVGHTWTDADGSGWFYPVGDPVQTVAVGDVSVDPAGGDWVVPQGRVQLPVYPLGTELSWVRDAAGVVHEAPLRLYVEHVARGPAVARVYRDGRVATEAIEVPSWGVVELAPTYAAPATLVVRVLDPDGAPAPGVRVAPQPVERGARAPEPGWSDVDGVVRFTVSDGPWLVEGRDLASRTGEGSVRPEAGSEVAVDLRVDRPADLVWPGWRLDDDGTVLGFADGSPLRALFDPGDHLSTAAGPLRNVDLEHHVRRTTGDFSVVVAAPDGAERTVALPARPTCDRSGRCTLATAGGEVVIRTSTGDRSGADALAPPRWPPPIPVIPPSPDRVACAQGDTAACGRANVYVPEPLPAREWRESGIHIPGHVELVFTADGALVAVSDGTWLAIDPVTGSVVSRSPLATGGEEVLDVRQVVALPDGGVRALVDDRDWVQRAPGGWVQVPVSDGRRVTWIGGSDGRPCGVMPTTDGAVGVWSPDPRCEQRPEVRRWDREGAVLSRTPAPPGGRDGRRVGRPAVRDRVGWALGRALRWTPDELVDPGGRPA